MRTGLFGWFALTLTGVTATEPKPEPASSYVEFDFSSLPTDGEGNCSFTVTVLTVDKDFKYSSEVKGPKKFAPDVVCASYAGNMTANRFKTEVVDKTKLRVYGRIFNDKLIPATKGMVESPDLKPEELPKVKNPEKKG